MKYLLFILLSCLVVSESTAQYKFEKESRIKSKLVPANARSFVNQLKGIKKLKWYEETSQDGKSYEAKLKLNAHKYSIEFDSTGQFLDIEKKVSHDTDKEYVSLIYKALAPKYKEVSIKKIQRQYLGDADEMILHLNNQSLAEANSCNYEVEFDVKDNGYKSYEVLIDTNGRVLRTSEIIDRIKDTIEF